MSVPSNSAQYMSSVRSNGITPTRNGTAERESFHKFFERWLSEQNQNLHDLSSAASSRTTTTTTESTQNENDEQILRPLLNRVVEHYELYYRAKSRWAKQDVLSMFSPSWRSTLEDAFLWIGGWRPSMAFHLLYSKSGLQLEDHLSDLISGLSTGDLADLSASQLNGVDELQRRTIREEKDLTEKMAKHQETVADASMVDLSHVVTELMQNNGGGGGGDANGGLEGDRVEATLASKEEGLEELLAKADDLRLRTLKSVLEFLSPIQAVHFLIAAAELHLRLHEWGKKKDARHQVNGVGRRPIESTQ